MYLVTKLRKTVLILAVACIFLGITIFNTIKPNKKLCRIDDTLITAPVLQSASDSAEKKVYLTFDDGPSKTTEMVLDILKQHNVNATFFVIADENSTQYLSLLTRSEKEGNLIALHSQTHTYKKIYKNTDAFWEDLDSLYTAISPFVQNIPKILRFPGGSSNTVSRKYGGSQIMQELKAEAIEKGYKYVDWNVCANDAMGGHHSASEIYSEVIKESKDKNICVVLFHDTNVTKSTAEALPDIIRYYKENGYVFDTIDKLDKQI